YEALRDWLGQRLQASPKEFTLIGSARIGYSLAPPPHFGKRFGPLSDLDISAISNQLFLRMCEDFSSWKEDWSEGRVQPRSTPEQKYWDIHSVATPDHIRRGFISSWEVPTLLKYPTAQKIGQSMYELKAKLDSTANAPKVAKAS